MLDRTGTEPKFDDILSDKDEDKVIQHQKLQKIIKPKKEGKLLSLKQMIVVLIATCWFFPIVIIFVVMSTTYRKGMIQKTEALLKDDVKNISTTITYNINEAIHISKNISYELQLEKQWKNYRSGKTGRAEFYKNATSIINTKFIHDSRFIDVVLYLEKEPDQLYPNKGKEQTFFTGEVEKTAREITELDTSQAFVKIIDDNIYVIRNLYAVQGYEKFGTLTVKLDTDKIFKDLSKNILYDIAFYFDDDESTITYGKNQGEDQDQNEILKEVRYKKLIADEKTITINSNANSQFIGYANREKERDYEITTILITDKDFLYSELESLYMVIGLLILFMIPILAFVIYFVSINVTKPIVKLVSVSKEIRGGNIGIQIEGDRKTMPNREFAYLMVSFNKMSAKIKYLFDYAYNEQLAKKDAKIMALQSQINPHFLNNTLEMMNWQARLSGDINVSKMIEALSVLLDHTIDRSNSRQISLADEIRSADAYLYIISMRFGQRLHVVKEIDESLLRAQVPQLILQPLLENAVVHGVELVKSGTIWLKVYQTEDTIKLQVENSGRPMTEEDEQRIEELLKREKHVVCNKGEYISLGIRNVNERIQLIYGEEYGLKIKGVGDDITAATITIPKEI